MTPPAQRRWAAAATLAVLSVLLLLSPQHGPGQGSPSASGASQAAALAAGPGGVAERLQPGDARGHERTALPWAAVPPTGSSPTGLCGTAGGTARPSCDGATRPGTAPVRGPPALARHL